MRKPKDLEPSARRAELNALFKSDPPSFDFYADYLVPIILAAEERGVAKFVALARPEKPNLWRRFYKAEESLAVAVLNLQSERKSA